MVKKSKMKTLRSMSYNQLDERKDNLRGEEIQIESKYRGKKKKRPSKSEQKRDNRRLDLLEQEIANTTEVMNEKRYKKKRRSR